MTFAGITDSGSVTCILARRLRLYRRNIDREKTGMAKKKKTAVSLHLYRPFRIVGRVTKQSRKSRLGSVSWPRSQGHLSQSQKEIPPLRATFFWEVKTNVKEHQQREKKTRKESG